MATRYALRGPFKKTTAMPTTIPHDVRDLIFRRSGEDGGPRDLVKDCDYTLDPQVEDFLEAYITNGVAARVIDLKPEETWQIDPKIVERDRGTSAGEDSSEWEDMIEDLVREHNLWAVCERADKDSRIGRYSIILLGVDDGKPLSEPIDGFGSKKTTARKLLYLNVFNEVSALVTSWEMDKLNPRFGRPTEYSIQIGDAGTGSLITEKVHWHRVVHIVDNCIGNGVFSIPVLSRHYNWVESDLKKLVGSSIEAYWQGAFPGYFLKVDASKGPLDAEQRAEITKETNNFVHSLKRWILTGGVEITPLKADWKDPTPALDLILKLAALGEGCPVPTFVGAEEGQLAGDQNTTHWGKTIQRRRERHAGPYIARPLIAALIGVGVLPTPKNRWDVLWKQSRALTDTERAAYAKTILEALSIYAKGGVATYVPAITLLVKICGFEQNEAEDMLRQAEEIQAELLEEIDPTTGLPYVEDPSMQDPEQDPEEDSEDAPEEDPEEDPEDA